ncbi:UNVERIFIED_CONTAM: hypothetical protein Scaly_1785000 [Sesamum calycinum]|uniref:Uncharacterized protein n=1 Tax=Sesamum calycinum TaxID=2727403 RepID=A0AAW2NVU3_9LAMI
MAPYEALYRRKYRSLICWDIEGTRQLEGPDLVQQTVDKIQIVKKGQKAAQNRQKSYVDKHRKEMEYEVGENILKVSPWRGILKFSKQEKLSPRYIGPYEFLNESDQNLGGIDICGGANRNFGSECKELRNQEISKVKVKWSHHSPRDATWEVKESMREKYPYLFHEPDYYEAPSVPQVSDEPTSAGLIEGNYPQWGDEQRIDWAQRMVFDAVGPSYFVSPHEGLAARFFNVVHAANQPLWDGCNQPQLDVVDVLVDIKADGHISERIYDIISQWANKILRSNHTLPGDYYSTKKLVKDLGLPVEKIHACKNGFMLYWKDDVDLEYCKFYGDEVVFLKGNYRAHNMVATHQTTEGSMCHPSDAEAWKHFHWMYLDFAEKPHNVRLGLYTDGFTPHGQYNRTYSCWSVIIIPYNLSLGMCISSEYMFLTMVIPGLSNPKHLIDVYLESLIEKLL